MIQRYTVKTYEEALVCVVCGTEMEFSGMEMPSHPPQYLHVCPECTNDCTVDHIYPRVVHERDQPVHEIKQEKDDK